MIKQEKSLSPLGVIFTKKAKKPLEGFATGFT